MLFIDQQQVTRLLPMQECIEVMRELFEMDPKTAIQNPLRGKMLLPEPNQGILGMMPASIKAYNLMGIKVLSVFPNNYKKGLSSHQGILHLFETDTGKLIASLDADEITAVRTAAVSALMTDLLSTDDAKKLCLIGSGRQAETHLEAIHLVRNIQQVSVWSRNTSNASFFKAKVSSKYQASFDICESIEEAVADADIICTLTASHEPLLFATGLKDSVHINAVGACLPHTRELATEVVERAEVFVDNYLAATYEAGDLIIPAKENKVDVATMIRADTHELLKNQSLRNPLKPTVFKSVGIAAEDLAAGYHCYKKLQTIK